MIKPEACGSSDFGAFCIVNVSCLPVSQYEYVICYYCEKSPEKYFQCHRGHDFFLIFICHYEFLEFGLEKLIKSPFLISVTSS